MLSSKFVSFLILSLFMQVTSNPLPLNHTLLFSTLLPDLLRPPQTTKLISCTSLFVPLIASPRQPPDVHLLSMSELLTNIQRSSMQSIFLLLSLAYV